MISIHFEPSELFVLPIALGVVTAWDFVFVLSGTCFLAGLVLISPLRKRAARSCKQLLRVALTFSPFAQPAPGRQFNRRGRWILWFAQGLGSGRIPWAPGTFGTILGVLWMAALASTGSTSWYLTGTVIGLIASVYLAGKAENLLECSDPGSVVCDEIAAFPVCLIPAMLIEIAGGREPYIAGSVGSAVVFAILFGLFRLFDIWKPWPIRISQRLPGGWGVTVDDVLAALYAGSVFFAPAILLSSCAKAR